MPAAGDRSRGDRSPQAQPPACPRLPGHTGRTLGKGFCTEATIASAQSQSEGRRRKQSPLSVTGVVATRPTRGRPLSRLPPSFATMNVNTRNVAGGSGQNT